MHRLFLFLTLTLSVMANDTITYFEQSPENKILCRVGQYSYKLLSQKNAVIENLHGHPFFKLKKENLYFLDTGCQKSDPKQEGIVF